MQFIQKQRPKFVRSYLWLTFLVCTLSVSFMFAYAYAAVRNLPVDTLEAKARQQEIAKIKASKDFQQFADAEAHRRYFAKVKADADFHLASIAGTPEHEERVARLTLEEYLTAKKSKLAANAATIAKLPRWIEVVAIAQWETFFCTEGVGVTHNNCGGIKNTSGTWKRYRTPLEGIEDVSILLQRPHYAGKTVAQMNGLYCQDARRPGRECAGWTENVQAIVDDLTQKITQ